MISISTVAAVAGIVLVAAVLQRTVGFGFALLAVPLMTFVIPTKSAIVVAFLNGTVASGWLVLRLHDQIEWIPTRRLGAGAVIGAPIGVVILSVVGATQLRLALGVTTCVAALWIIISSRRAGAVAALPRRSRTFALGLASGVLSTSLATNGPPLVYELRRTGLEEDRFRATISAVFLVADIVGLPLLAAAGLITASDVVLAAISVLPCLAGIVVGSWISHRLDPSHFVWAVDLLLLATGAVTITKALS